MEVSWRRNSGCWLNIKGLMSALCGVSTKRHRVVDVSIAALIFSDKKHLANKQTNKRIDILYRQTKNDSR